MVRCLPGHRHPLHPPESRLALDRPPPASVPGRPAPRNPPGSLAPPLTQNPATRNEKRSTSIMKNLSFLRHAAVYSMATLLVQAGGFVLLPLYTRCLSPADYGILEVLGRLAETVGTCLLFGGFRQALLTFYQQSDGEGERRRVVGTTLGLVACTCLLGGGLVLPFAEP